MAANTLRLAATGHHANQLRTIIAVDRVQTLAQFAGIQAVACQQAHGADNADIGLAAVELLAGLLADGLQAIEVDINREGGNHFAIDHQRKHDAGQQYVLPVDLIEIGFDDARFQRCARACEPRVIGLTAGSDARIGHVAFRQRHRR